MSASKSPVPLLSFGLRASPAEKISAEEIKKAASEAVSKLEDQGFSIELYFVDVGNDNDEYAFDGTKILADARELLGRQTWAGINIGFGLRGTPQLTTLFEDLINLVFREATRMQPMPKIVFAYGPADVYHRFMKALPPSGT